MFDLFEAYLLIIILLLVGNIGLFLVDFKMSKIKYIFISIIISIIIFTLSFFKLNLSFLNDIFGWLFIVIAIILFIVNYFYLENKISLKISTISTIIIFFILTCLTCSQIKNLELISSISYLVISLTLFLVLNPIADLLHYAKREYSNIVGEFMTLESILLFILGVTFWSVNELNYEMFSSFLILTPTYKLVYVLIGIIFILIIGIYYNDIKLKKR